MVKRMVKRMDSRLCIYCFFINNIYIYKFSYIMAYKNNTMNTKLELGGRRRTRKNIGQKNGQNVNNITGTRGRGTFLRNWSKMSPGYHERTLMMKRCGKKCFLGPGKTFPICRRGTCKPNKKGIYAAFVRAREYVTIKGTRKYRQISEKAMRLLQKKI